MSEKIIGEIDTKELARELEEKAERDTSTFLENAVIFNSALGEWVELAGVGQDHKVIVSTPEVVDKHKEQPPDLIIFVQLNDSSILVAPSDVKVTMPSKAGQITRGRIYRAFRNPEFWQNFKKEAGRKKDLGEITTEQYQLVIEGVTIAEKCAGEIQGRISQEALDAWVKDRGEKRLLVGTGFYTTTLLKKDGSTRELHARSIDDQNVQPGKRVRLIPSAFFPSREHESIVWVCYGKDEWQKSGGERIERPLMVGNKKFKVRREVKGPPRRNRDGKLLDENSISQLIAVENQVVLEFLTREENQRLYAFSLGNLKAT